MRLRICLFALVFGAPLSALADGREPSAPEGWSIGADLRVGGLENYPAVGVSVDALHRFGRWRVGPELSVYAPKAHGDVRRFAIGTWLMTEFLIVEARRVHLTWDMGLGIGLLRDDYRQRAYFDDLTRVAPGLFVGMGLAFVATERVHIVIDVRGVYYWGGRIADHEWLEFGLGVRVRM